MDNQPNQFHYAGLFSMTDDYWVKSTQKFQFSFFYIDNRITVDWPFPEEAMRF